MCGVDSAVCGVGVHFAMGSVHTMQCGVCSFLLVACIALYKIYIVKCAVLCVHLKCIVSIYFLEEQVEARGCTTNIVVRQ